MRASGLRLLIEEAVAATDQAHPELDVLQVNATELSQPLYAKHGLLPNQPDDECRGTAVRSHGEVASLHADGLGVAKIRA
jgi:hypothetical protein